MTGTKKQNEACGVGGEMLRSSGDNCLGEECEAAQEFGRTA